MYVQIRAVEIAEVAALQDISRSTFEETFTAGNDAAELQLYIDKAFSIEKLQDELEAVDSQFYFIEKHDTVIGYLKLNFKQAQTEQMPATWMEVERIYILQFQQGMGLGQTLLDFAIAQAIDKGCDHIWLGVWERNTKAIAFYKKNDFQEIGAHTFMFGNVAQTDLIFCKTI